MTADPSGPMRLVVIGADAAGMSAANQALRAAKAADRPIEVVALESTQDTSYSACGIPYWIAGEVASDRDLVARTADEHRAAGIDLRLRSTATGIDPRERTVSYVRDGQERQVDYDELVIATGASALVPDWARWSDGGLIPGVAPVKALSDGRHWLELLRPGQHVVIAGGSYIGVEMAEALLRRRCRVTVVTRSRVMSSLDPEMSERIERGLVEAGVELVTETSIVGLDDTTASGLAVVSSAGTTYACDLLVLALGVTPNTGFTGLPTGVGGALCPDPDGVVADGIWAAGDCCSTVDRITGERTFLPLGTHANKMGRVVGSNVVVPGTLRFPGVLGTAISRFVGGDVHVEFSRTGLSSEQAEQAGIDALALTTEGTTSSGYMPGAEPIALRVLAERGTRRLLGAQIVGGREAAKRIDTFAMALWMNATVDNLAWADLSYAPPFSTTWEIAQIAARRVAERL